MNRLETIEIESLRNGLNFRFRLNLTKWIEIKRIWRSFLYLRLLLLSLRSNRLSKRERIRLYSRLLYRLRALLINVILRFRHHRNMLFFLFFSFLISSNLFLKSRYIVHWELSSLFLYLKRFILGTFFFLLSLNFSCLRSKRELLDRIPFIYHVYDLLSFWSLLWVRNQKVAHKVSHFFWCGVFFRNKILSIHNA